MILNLENHNKLIHKYVNKILKYLLYNEYRKGFPCSPSYFSIIADPLSWLSSIVVNHLFSLLRFTCSLKICCSVSLITLKWFTFNTLHSVWKIIACSGFSPNSHPYSFLLGALKAPETLFVNVCPCQPLLQNYTPHEGTHRARCESEGSYVLQVHTLVRDTSNIS